MIFFLKLIFVFFSVHQSHAFGEDPSQLSYYSLETISIFNDEETSQEQFEEALAKSIRGSFNPLEYRQMKRVLFGEIYLQRDEKGYFVKDVYCNKKVRSRVGPNRVPKNSIMNVEHTFPQSYGAKRRGFKSDMHHLCPSDSRANSYRGNFIFGEVKSGKSPGNNCSSSKRERIRDPKSHRRVIVFQPPPDHRGNVARAIFYSVLKYRETIERNYQCKLSGSCKGRPPHNFQSQGLLSDLEEGFLRKWDELDPPDEEEIRRNSLIERYQGNRNPFVDFEGLVKRIPDL